jgi:uncharacterized SAM-binding protein YcdF (DUF218 family)
MGIRSEAHVMRDYLLRHHNHHMNLSTTILVEDQSMHTFDNAFYSKQLLLDRTLWPPAKLVVVTHDWHMARSRQCFEAVFGPDMVLDLEVVVTDPNDPDIAAHIQTENQMMQQGWVEAKVKEYGLETKSHKN